MFQDLGKGRAMKYVVVMLLYHIYFEKQKGCYKKLFYLPFSKINQTNVDIFSLPSKFEYPMAAQPYSSLRRVLRGRLHEPIKCPFSAPISGLYVVNHSVSALKTGPS